MAQEIAHKNQGKSAVSNMLAEQDKKADYYPRRQGIISRKALATIGE